SGASIYHWSPSLGLSSNAGSIVMAFPPQHTIYTVTGISQYGCIGHTLMPVRVYPTPVKNLRDSAYLCLGSPFTLNAGYNDSASYQWQDGSTDQFYHVNMPGIYWVTVRNAGCTVSDTVQVDICTSVWIPNAFTPDGNNQNDYFMALSGTELQQFSMYIYNRFGDLVFESHDIMKGWDGRFKGSDCPEGVYVYVITWEGQGNVVSEKEGLKRGAVMLVR
ncbi:MAG: gliding motility-associated C-terminal domain-containing protein, partial [Bacteroidetes bacterium]|nr:gliding motility-associated C-terminal domain-containing protein [Bacteroidota bacterium]